MNAERKKLMKKDLSQVHDLLMLWTRKNGEITFEEAKNVLFELAPREVVNVLNHFGSPRMTLDYRELMEMLNPEFSYRDIENDKTKLKSFKAIWKLIRLG
jgi:hypothetical protein